MEQDTRCKIHVAPARAANVMTLSRASLTVGTGILTAQGTVPAEDLKPGDRVVTKDYGLQKLQFVSCRDTDLTQAVDLAPIAVTADHLNLDRQSYFAPTQHMALRHPMFDMLFGAPEVLICCGDVADQPGFVPQRKLRSITYIALEFARSQIIFANGAPVAVGPLGQKPARIVLGPEEAKLALQLMIPKTPQPKRHSFPLQ